MENDVLISMDRNNGRTVRKISEREKEVSVKTRALMNVFGAKLTIHQRFVVVLPIQQMTASVLRQVSAPHVLCSHPRF